MMHCTLARADNTNIHTSLMLAPVRYSASGLGGPDAATINVSGDKNALSDVLTWLACKITIYNDGGLPVWWGLVQAVRLALDGVEYGLDAGPIINRMAAVYVDAESQSAITTIVEDARSVALYGRREAKESVKADTATTAVALATRYIAERSAPLRSVATADAGAAGATLSCVGLWRTLDWRFWSQPVGEILRDEEINTTELLGWAVSGADIGLSKPLQKICRLAAGLHVLAETDRLVVDGSTSDGVYEVTEPEDRLTVTTYTDNKIYFDASDDVHDADGVLNQFRPGDLLEIDGSTLNDGIYFIKDFFQDGDGLYNHMRVKPGTIVDEAAGATVTLEVGTAVAVTPRPAYELPGSTITLASQAVKLAMTVTIGSDQGELSEIWIQAARIGSPADNLKIEWCANDGGSGLPGTVLKSATVTGSTLPLLESLDWVQWTFDHGLVMTPGTYYVVVSRTGSADDAAYRIGLHEAEVDFSSADALLLYNGSSWIARTVASGLDAALGLRIFAQRETTTQIVDVVTGVGDWLSGASVRTASGLRTRRYRSAEQGQTAQSEIRELLDFGTSGNARLLARVSADRVLLIDTAPASTTPGYIWTAEGLRDRWGVRLPDGVLPVGEWVAFDVAGASGVFAPAFVEAAEFDVASGSVRPSFRSEQPVQALARLASPANVPDLAARLRPLIR